MRVTHGALFQLRPPPCVRSIWGWAGGAAVGGSEGVDGGGAVHTGAVVLSVWHIKLYKGNHLCATPYY